jgi:hypothetical protein
MPSASELGDWQAAANVERNDAVVVLRAATAPL